MVKNFILVAAGGTIGSVLRYWFSIIIKHNYLPFATFTVNVIGCFIIGLVMGWVSKNNSLGEWRLFLATGICGGFTTFSSFSWENINLLEHERYVAFGLYLSASILLGLSATVVGYWLTK